MFVVQVPEELAPYITGDRLEVKAGGFSDVAPLAAYLQAQENLTHIAISDDVSIPKQADGTPAHQVLALAVSRSQSPNILEASIAGNHYANQLSALCDGNRRDAIRLLTQAQDSDHVLTKSECLGIKARLPAMLAIAETYGPSASKHSMTQPQLADMLERIRDHARQYNIETGVEPHIERLRPKAVVQHAEHEGYSLPNGAARNR